MLHAARVVAVRSPVSAIDPNSEGNGAAYPLRLSESVACLLLTADGVEQTDDWEEKDGGGRPGGGGGGKMLHDSQTIGRDETSTTWEETGNKLVKMSE